MTKSELHRQIDQTIDDPTARAKAHQFTDEQYAKQEEAALEQEEAELE